MSTLLRKLPSLLRSRVALNIYFWLLIVITTWMFNNKPFIYPAVWYYLLRAFSVVLLAALLYANNLWLMPLFFIKGKRRKYFLILFVVASCISLCNAGLLELATTYFPKMEMNDIFILTTLKVAGISNWMLRVLLQALIWLLPFSVFLFIFSLAWYMHDYERQKKISEEAQKKQAEAELSLLKNQLNPHFLFNTLNNLYTLTLKKSDHAPDIVSKLSTILRYLLYESNINEVSFEREKEIMHAYIDLELLRLSNKNGLQFTVTADRSYNIPPLLWVPILENVFKHGTRFISNEYSIEYSFIIQNNTLSIHSKNRFKNIKGNGTPGGIGLSNLQKRLALLFPGKHTVQTLEEDNFFTTQVQIQLA